VYPCLQTCRYVLQCAVSPISCCEATIGSDQDVPGTVVNIILSCKELWRRYEALNAHAESNTITCCQRGCFYDMCHDGQQLGCGSCTGCPSMRNEGTFVFS
jgi:hypothetical protein